MKIRRFNLHSRLAIALGISLFLHCLLIQVPLHFSIKDARHPIFQVTLENAGKFDNQARKPVSHIPFTSLAKQSITPPLPPKNVIPKISPESPPSDSNQPLTSATHKNVEADADISLPQNNSTSATPDLINPPRWALIEFDVRQQDKHYSLVQEYTADEHSRYILEVRKPNVEDKTSNQPALKISGAIGGRGLVAYEYDARDNPLVNELIERNPEAQDTRSGRMPDGILDRFSILYQFMFRASRAFGERLTLSDGKNIIAFIHSDIGFEKLDLFNQSIQTQHHHFVSTDTQTSIDIWVAPAMRNLPVRVRYTDGNGITTEMVAKSLQSN